MVQKNPTQDSISHPHRRDFLKTTSTLAAAGALFGGLSIARSAHAAGDDTLKIGLIGCGGRGSGAAANALRADKNCKLVAMADLFSDRLDASLKALQSEMGDKVAVDEDHRFLGFDAGMKLIQSDVDVVLLAESPHFRPAHLKAAVEAGKHIFAEKPVAVDAPGVRSVLASVEEAKKKNLNLVAGLCWRYDYGVRETMKKVLDGAIGQIKAIRETYLASPLSFRPRQPEWTEMEFQLRNWQYFTWLSGDFNVEQHVHSLDKAAWAMGDEPPKRAFGMGGRQLRAPEQGNVYDHHAVVYEYDNGVQVFAYCRQMPNCWLDINDVFIGDKGEANILQNKITGENKWKYSGPKPNMYDVEHEALFSAIRSGNAINNGEYLARSSMLGILGRMVNYTGQPLTWEEAINSQETLGPKRYAFDAEAPTLPDKDGRYLIPTPETAK